MTHVLPGKFDIPHFSVKPCYKRSTGSEAIRTDAEDDARVDP